MEDIRKPKSFDALPPVVWGEGEWFSTRILDKQCRDLKAENARLNGTLEFVRAIMLNNCIDCKDNLDDDCERCSLKNALVVIGRALNGKGDL